MAIFADLAALAAEKRVTFIMMRICVESRVSIDRAAPRQTKLVAEVSYYGADDMTAVQMDYAPQLLERRIKMDDMAAIRDGGSSGNEGRRQNPAPRLRRGLKSMSSRYLRLARTPCVPAAGAIWGGSESEDRGLARWEGGSCGGEAVDDAEHVSGFLGDAGGGADRFTDRARMESTAYGSGTANRGGSFFWGRVSQGRLCGAGIREIVTREAGGIAEA